MKLKNIVEVSVISEQQSKTLEGTLITESLKVGSELHEVPLRVTSIRRRQVGNASAQQSPVWTLLDFQADQSQAQILAESLAACLSDTGGWYVNYSTTDEAFVIFPGRVFQYSRGAQEGRAEAIRYGRSIGIPESQLDWED